MPKPARALSQTYGRFEAILGVMALLDQLELLVANTEDLSIANDAIPFLNCEPHADKQTASLQVGPMQLKASSHGFAR